MIMSHAASGCSKDMSVQLQVKTFDGEPRHVTVDHLPALIGRKHDADVWIGDRFVSHVHCMLRCEDSVLVVQDLNSRNGIRLNGHDTDVASIVTGDAIELGLSRIVVESITLGGAD